MSDKKIVKYTSASFYGANPVGNQAYVKTIDHPSFSAWEQTAIGLTTSTIVSYDETTGHIETLNTLYVPATSTVEEPAA